MHSHSHPLPQDAINPASVPPLFSTLQFKWFSSNAKFDLPQFLKSFSGLPAAFRAKFQLSQAFCAPGLYSLSKVTSCHSVCRSPRRRTSSHLLASAQYPEYIPEPHLPHTSLTLFGCLSPVWLRAPEGSTVIAGCLCGSLLRQRGETLGI